MILKDRLKLRSTSFEKENTKQLILDNSNLLCRFWIYIIPVFLETRKKGLFTTDNNKFYFNGKIFEGKRVNNIQVHSKTMSPLQSSYVKRNQFLQD